MLPNLILIIPVISNGTKLSVSDGATSKPRPLDEAAISTVPSPIFMDCGMASNRFSGAIAWGDDGAIAAIGEGNGCPKTVWVGEFPADCVGGIAIPCDWPLGVNVVG